MVAPSWKPRHSDFKAPLYKQICLGIVRPGNPKVLGKLSDQITIFWQFSLPCSNDAFAPTKFNFPERHLEQLLWPPVFSLEACGREDQWTLKDSCTLPGVEVLQRSDYQARDSISQPALHVGGITWLVLANGTWAESILVTSRMKCINICVSSSYFLHLWQS